MKKYLSIVLAVAMAAALGVSAFASTCVPDDDGNIFYDVPGCNVTPVMDGKIADGEYSEIATKKSQWSIAVSDDENDDLAWALAESAKVYMTWDADYVYYASVFTAPKGFDSIWEGDEGSMWYSGAIQMTFTDLASKEDDTQNRLEYGIGTTKEGTKLTTVWANAEGFEYDPEAIKDNFAIGKDGNTITFETRTPYSVFADVKGAEGTKIAGNVVYSIGEDQDYIHAQLSAGCTGEGGKNQIHDAVFTFVAAPVIETEPPETEAPAPETAAPAPETAAPVAETAAPVAETAAPAPAAAPAAAAPAAQTADMTAVVVLAAVAAIGTAVVVSKKH